jgi:glycosyltransferase involved in cell wall biosynthesis
MSRGAKLAEPFSPVDPKLQPPPARPISMPQVECEPAPVQARGLSPAPVQLPPEPIGHSALATAARPWLSILVPVYNVGDFLEHCLQSILLQLEPGIEVVVLDDASTDASAAIIASFQSRIGAVLRLIRHPRNCGLAAARNSLLENAEGDYFWFVDADDLISPGAIASLRKVLESTSPDLLTCDFRVHRERFRLKHRLRGEGHRRTFGGVPRQLSENPSTLASGILINGQLHAWSKIARRDVWQRVRFPEGRYFEDIAVLSMLLDATRSHYHVPEPWVVYRQRSGSILSSMNAEKIRHQLRALRELGTGLQPSRRLLDREARFALQHFVLKSLASLARRLAADRSAESAELVRLLNDSLHDHFPDGPGPVLRAYCRRGWFLRAWRAHASLRRIGVQAVGTS